MPLSKKELQDLVREIHKEAKPFTGTVEPMGTHVPPPPSGGGGVAPKVHGAIKDMQDAMQNFAAVATTYAAKKKVPGQPQPTDLDVNKRHFNDFIAEQYLTSADMKGEEFTPDEKRVSRESKQPTDLIEMNIIINGLKRIGGRNSELAADNMWDFRTNNALKNIYAFAYGLVQLTNDFRRTTSQAFSQEDLDKMKSNIPEDRDPSEIPMNEKVEKAKQLTPLIRKLTNFYKYYISNVAMHPAFKRYIIDNEPMITLQKGGDPAALNSDQKQMMQNADNLSIGTIPYIDQILDDKSRGSEKGKGHLRLPGPQGEEVGYGGFPLSRLQSVDSFKSLIASLGYPRNKIDNRVMRYVLDNIMNHIDAVLALPTAQKPSTPAPATSPAPVAEPGSVSKGPATGVKDVT